MIEANPTSAAANPLARRALSPVIWLLVVSVGINYLDRGNLAVAAPLLKHEMNLSPSQLGLLLSSFFWTYALCQLPAGWVVDRFGANWILPAGLFLWSGATALTGWVGGFASLLAVRLVLGIGESVAYPCYSKTLSMGLEEAERGMANVLIDVGSKCGPALGTVVGGLLVARYGWRPFFVILGLAAMLWIPCWLYWMPRGHHARRREHGRGPPFWHILAHRSMGPACWGHFCGNYYWYFLLTWLPSYLVGERHFTMVTMGFTAALPLAFSALSTLVVGWISFRALERGATPTRVRKTCVGAGLALSTTILLVPIVTSPVAAIALLIVASCGYGSFATSHWAIAQTIAGPGAVGRWSGVQNFAGNLSGVIAPAVTGFIVQATGNYFDAFAATAAVALSGSLVYIFALGPVEPADWSAISAARGV